MLHNENYHNLHSSPDNSTQWIEFTFILVDWTCVIDWGPAADYNVVMNRLAP